MKVLLINKVFLNYLYIYFLKKIQNKKLKNKYSKTNLFVPRNSLILKISLKND